MFRLFSMFAAVWMTLSAEAATVSYRIYDPEYRQFSPFIINLAFSGSFGPESRLVAASLHTETPRGTLVLFSWNTAEIQKMLRVEWSPERTLLLKSRSGFFFGTKVLAELPNPYWGNAGFVPGHRYSMRIPGTLELGPRAAVNTTPLTLQDETAGEFAISGIPSYRP